MNIFKVFQKLDKNNLKVFYNGYSTVEFMDDSHELKISDEDGNEVVVITDNWKELRTIKIRKSYKLVEWIKEAVC